MNRLYRSRTDRVIAGVCGGLAEYLQLDPLLIRALFIILAVMTGVGVGLYILLWIFVPEAEREYGGSDEMIRSNVQEIREKAESLAQEARSALREGKAPPEVGNRLLVVGGILISIGLLLLLRNFGLLVWLNKLWPLVLIALGLLVLINSLKERGR